VLPLAEADRLVADLGRAEAARVLEGSGTRDFGYASLYLDTPELTGYHLSARGRRRRFKVRRRTYLDTGQSFLEVKTRGGRGSTVKERTPDDEGRHPGLDPAGRAFVDAVLVGAGDVAGLVAGEPPAV
jgi:hypothetical protein